MRLVSGGDSNLCRHQEEIVHRFPTVVAALVAATMLSTAAWALAAPRSFYDTVATYPPYNVHFIHDIGAFIGGVGAAAAAAFVVRRPLTVALVGNAVAAVLHAGSHIADRHRGGFASDPWAMSLIALVLLAAAGVASRGERA
jgi:hypothetical protein